MTKFTEKQAGDTTFQLSGVFCFYSRSRGAEYNSIAYKLGETQTEKFTVNYFGTMLSDGTPGGVASDTLVRPDNADTYVLIGKVITDPRLPRNQTFLMPVDLDTEVAQQLGLPLERIAPAQHDDVSAGAPAIKHTPEKKMQEEAQRRAFDRDTDTKFKLHMKK